MDMKIEELHMKCHREAECTKKCGFCHDHMIESTTSVDGNLVLTRLIRDCSNSMNKV